MTKPTPPANAFEQGMPGTAGRDRSEGMIEGFRRLGGVFVDAVRATRVAMVLTDPHLPGNPVVFANQSFLDLSGYSMEEVLGQQPHFMNGSDTDPEDAERFRRILAEEQDGLVETVQYAKNGRRFVAAVLLSGFKDEAGKTVHHFLTWTDISRRVAAEGEVDELHRTQGALRESEAKYRVLFDTIDSGYALTDNVRDEEGRVVDLFGVEFNRSYTQHSGLPPFAGRRASEVITVQPEWLRQFEEVARTGVPARHEDYIAERDRWVSTHYSLVGDLGSDRVAVVFDDITDRKRAEQRLRESEEQQGFLLRLSDTLRTEEGPRAIASVSVAAIAEHMKLDRAYVAQVDKAHDLAEIGPEFRRADLPPVAGILTLSEFPEAWSRVEAATLVLSDIAQDQTLSPADREGFAALNMGAVMVASARKGMLNPVWSMLVATTKPRQWTSAEIATLEETTERTWAAMERARSEIALRGSEERFRGFAENSSDALWILNAETMKLEYLSPAYERIWGEPRQPVIEELGRWADSLHPEDGEKVGGALPRAIAGETVISDYRIVRPDGEVRYIRDTGFPIHDDGKVRRVGGIAQDVTDLKLAEQELARTAAWTSTLLNGIPQLVWRAGGPGIWTWASPQWTDFTGQSSADSCGSGWLECLHPDDRVAAKEAWSRALEEGGLDVDYRVREARTGAYRWFQTRATPSRDANGEITEWLGTSTDVDDIRRLEQHQRVLLAELQHRVRNTLGIIRSIARRTADTAESVDSHASHLDGRLSAFARVQAIVTRSPEGGVSLREIVEDELVAHAARDGECVEIAGDDANLPPRVAERLSLAVHELATNSVKYGALQDGEACIRVEWRTEGKGDRRQLSFTWAETGVAMSPDEERREGFGTELLTRQLAYELKADATLEFTPEGVRYHVVVPLPAAD